MTCANGACVCREEVAVTEQGADYCSEHCADAVPALAAPCECGHGGCSAPVEQADSTRQGAP